MTMQFESGAAQATLAKSSGVEAVLWLELHSIPLSTISLRPILGAINFLVLLHALLQILASPFRKHLISEMTSYVYAPRVWRLRVVTRIYATLAA